MSQFYPDEHDRAQTLRPILNHAGFNIYASYAGKTMYMTDGHTTCNSRPTVILEVRNEIGTTGVLACLFFAPKILLTFRHCRCRTFLPVTSLLLLFHSRSWALEEHTFNISVLHCYSHRFSDFLFRCLHTASYF